MATPFIFSIFEQMKHVSRCKYSKNFHIGEASYGRIEARKVALTYRTLADIASCFNMEVLDILTYPYHFVMATKDDKEPAEVMLQIKLKKEKREKVMRLIFGDNNIEILDK